MSNSPDRLRAAELASALTVFKCSRAFETEIQKLNPHQIARIVLQLQREASAQKTAATNLCNIADYQETYDKKTASARARVAKLLEPFPGVKARLGGDPRGACFYLAVPGIGGDGWDEDESTGLRTWAVY